MQQKATQQRKSPDLFDPVPTNSRAAGMAWIWKGSKVAPGNGQSLPLSAPEAINFLASKVLQGPQASSDSVDDAASEDSGAFPSSSVYSHTSGSFLKYFLSQEVSP